MAAPAGLVNSLNRIREISSDIYHQYIPVIDENTDISAFGKPVLQYQAVQNEFMSALINRIVATQFEIKFFNNPLRVLEGDKLPLGQAVQDIYANPIKGRQFNVNDFAGLLAKYEADVKVQYFEVNSDIQYPVTITKAKLQKAFTSWDNLNTFVDEITNALYNGAYIDEYEQAKGLITTAYANNRVVVESIAAVSDEETAKAFTEKARELFLNFQTPSTAYNAWKKLGGEGRAVKTWTNPEDILIIVKNSVRAKLDVQSLASAFNVEYAKLLGNIISVPDFDIRNEDGTIHTSGANIVGMICDKAWFKIREQDRDFSEFYNANNRTWQFYLNVVKMYNYSLFANAVVFATAQPPIEATAITFGSEAETQEAGITEGYELTVTPGNAASKIVYSTEAEAEGITFKPSEDGRVVYVTVAEGTESETELTITATAYYANPVDGEYEPIDGVDPATITITVA